MRFLVMVKPNKDEVSRYEAGSFPESFNDEEWGRSTKRSSTTAYSWRWAA